MHSIALPGEPKLRFYQTPIIEESREARRKYRDVLIQGPTGIGKTHMIIYMIYRSIKLTNKTWWVQCHLREILDATAERLDEWGLEYDWIASGKSRGDARIKLVMSQTVVRLIEKGQLHPDEVPDVIFKDECHHDFCERDRKIRDFVTQHGARHIGASATPVSPTGKGMKEFYPYVVLGPQPEELIAINRANPNEGLVPPRIYYPPNDFDRNALKKKKNGDIDLISAARELDKKKITGKAVDEYLRICPGVPFIVFESTVERAEKTAQAFRDVGISCQAIDGKMNEYQRRSIFQGFKNQSTTGLSNVNLFLEGVDVPGVVCIIWLRPTESLWVWLQGNGRAARAGGPSKVCYYVIDHVGNVLVPKLGKPHANRDWDLDATARTTKKQKEEAAQALRRCFNCHVMFEPAPECPYCGEPVPKKEREIEQVDGQLIPYVEDDRLHAQLVQIAQAKAIKEKLKFCKTLEQCQKFAISIGLTEGHGKQLFYGRIAKQKAGKVRPPQ